MFIIDAQAHPIGLMDIDRYRPREPESHPAPKPMELPSPYGGPSMGPRDWYVDELISVMDQFGVNKSVIMCGGIQVTNHNLAAAVGQYPDRLLAFAGYEHYQPNSLDSETTAKAIAAMEYGIKELGFKGVGEVHLDRFSPVSPSQLYIELRPIMEVCKKYRVPVYFHTGHERVTFRIERKGEEGSSWSYHPAPLPYRDPVYLDAVALEYPEVPIMIGHMGGKYPRYFEGALMVAQRHKNVYLTTPNTLPEFVARAVAEIGAERVIWGSDWAWRSVKPPAPTVELGHAANLAVLRQAGLTEAQNETILGRTMATLLNITSE